VYQELIRLILELIQKAVQALGKFIAEMATKNDTVKLLLGDFLTGIENGSNQTAHA
jgi:hypothetical protein